MPYLATFSDLHTHKHTLGLHCPVCNRWGEADLAGIVSSGKGAKSLITTRFCCCDCGSAVEKQVRPPVPAPGGALGYIAGRHGG